MREIQDDPELTLLLAVTGMHLSDRFGLTWREIAEDGFAIDARVEILSADESPLAVARSMARGLSGMAEAFERLGPDIVVVLGDRFEILAAAQAAMVMRIPLAHIHGGESTEGAIDEAMRHSVTKMAQLHFVACEPYARRVVQLGEQPDRVFCFGAPGLDAIDRLDLPDIGALEYALGSELGEGFLLVTYHPVTLCDRDPGDAVSELLASLDEFPERRIVITGVNADPDHDRVARQIADYAERRGQTVLLRTSLGRVLYLGAMRHCAVVVGNSSSGIIEAPAMRVPSVNLGERQRGRLRSASVIDCAEARADIVAALRKALSPEFQAAARRTASAYGHGGASQKIKRVLKEAPLDGILMKRFYDLSVS